MKVDKALRVNHVGRSEAAKVDELLVVDLADQTDVAEVDALLDVDLDDQMVVEGVHLMEIPHFQATEGIVGRPI